MFGCAHSEHALRPTGDYVAAIDFEVPDRKGLFSPYVGQQSNASMEAALAQEASGWQTVLASWIFPRLVDLAWLDERGLADEGRRLETWYAHHGYFDAHFRGWDIKRRGKKRAQRPVKLVGHVERGLPSRVRTVTIDGWDAVDRVLRRSIEAHLDVVSGNIFDLGAYEASINTIRTSLAEHAFAYATVEGDVQAYPAEHAVDINIHVLPGSSARFGQVTFSGTHLVPDRLLAHDVAITPGEGFSASALAKTRARLFGLRVFSVVNVIPDLSHPESREVPVRIEVVEGHTRSLEAGPSLFFENNLQSLSVRASWRDDNVLHRLWRWDQSAELGVATLIDPAITTPLGEQIRRTAAPIGSLQEKVTIPRVYGSDFSLVLDSSLTLGIEPGYRYFSPEASPQITWSGIDRTLLSLAYRLRYYDYCSPDFVAGPCPDLKQSVDLSNIDNQKLKLDNSDPYLLSIAEARAVFDGRNNALSATRGWYGSLALGSAGGPLGGDYDFFRMSAELRAYRSIVRIGRWDPDTVLAGRIGGGLIQPYSTTAKVAYAERFYLGGGNTVRGWGNQRLGPRIVRYPEETGVGEVLPAGGLVDCFGSAEIRKKLPFDLTAVAFLDGGRVWDRPEYAAFKDIQWTVGGGFRYATPVGPLRFDVGVRLGDDPFFADVNLYPRWTGHLGLGEAF